MNQLTILGMGAGALMALIGSAGARCIGTPLSAYGTALNWHLTRACIQSCKDELWGRNGEANRILEAQGDLFLREWYFQFRHIEPVIRAFPYQALIESALGGAVIGWLDYQISPFAFIWGMTHLTIDGGRKAYRAVISQGELISSV